MKPRIVLVTAHFPARSETFIVDKFLALMERGFDVHVLASRRGSVEPFPELSAAEIDLERRVHASEPGPLIATLLRSFTRPVRSGRALVAVRRRGWSQTGRAMVRSLQLVALDPQLVHVEFGWLAPRLVRPARTLGGATVVSFRGADANYFGLDEPGYYDDVWTDVDAVHCLGDDLWRRVQSRGCPPEMLHSIIPPAVDAGRFDPDDRPPHDGPLRLVSVGRLHWKKGYEYAVQAVDIARRVGVDVDLRIVGEGGFRPAVEAAIADLDLGDQVTLVGAASRDEVRSELQRADVFVHAAVSEGFANAVLEAQAMALPVVTSDADGLAANVAHGETGYVVARRDPSALADRIIELAGSPDKRSQLGQAGRRRVREHFRPSDQVTAFVELYEALLAP